VVRANTHDLSVFSVQFAIPGWTFAPANHRPVRSSSTDTFIPLPIVSGLSSPSFTFQLSSLLERTRCFYFPYAHSEH
jgi:hypothetical protein